MRFQAELWTMLPLVAAAVWAWQLLPISPSWQMGEPLKPI